MRAATVAGGSQFPFGAEVVGTVGDVNAPEYDGGWILKTQHGYQVEYVAIPSDDDMKGGEYTSSARWTVYRVDLDPGVPSWGDIKAVASSSGQSVKELRAAFKSDDPAQRAYAYETWAGHYGWHELDNYPLTLTRAEVEKRYDVDLGHRSSITSALEEEVERLADDSSATAWSYGGDQLESDLEGEGYDPKSLVIEAKFGDAVAVNGDPIPGPHWAEILGIKANDLWSEVGTDKLTDWLDKNGYDYLDTKGGRVPAEEGYASGETAIDAVAERLKLPVEQVTEVAESLDWWQEEIPRSTSGRTYVWAKKKSGEDRARAPRAPERKPAGPGLPTLVTGALSPQAKLVESGHKIVAAGQKKGVKFDIYFDPAPPRKAHGQGNGHYAVVVYTPYVSEAGDKGVEAEQIGLGPTKEDANQIAHEYVEHLWEDEKSNRAHGLVPLFAGARRHAREYIAVDHAGRKIGGPFKDYDEAKRQADSAQGYVKWASEAREPGKLTLAQARQILAPLGIVIKSLPETREYRVNFKGGVEGSAYYTNDLEDAVATGKHMAHEQRRGHGGRFAPGLGAREQLPLFPPRIKTTFSTIKWGDEEDSEDYEEEHGWIDEEGSVIELDDYDKEAGTTIADKAAEWLKSEGAIEPSSTAFHIGVWYSTEDEEDYQTGEHTTRSFHLYGFTPEQEQQVFEQVAPKWMRGRR